VGRSHLPTHDAPGAANRRACQAQLPQYPISYKFSNRAFPMRMQKKSASARLTTAAHNTPIPPTFGLTQPAWSRISKDNTYGTVRYAQCPLHRGIAPDEVQKRPERILLEAGTDAPSRRGPAPRTVQLIQSLCSKTATRTGSAEAWLT